MRAILLFSIVITMFTTVSAQEHTKVVEAPPAVDTWGLYTGDYSIEMAKEFEWDWEYEKAIWIYINLMPTEHKAMAVKRVKNLKAKVGDLISFIDNTFQYYAMLDPEITKPMKGSDTLKIEDPELLTKKRQWTDELIQAVSN